MWGISPYYSRPIPLTIIRILFVEKFKLFWRLLQHWMRILPVFCWGKAGRLYCFSRPCTNSIGMAWSQFYLQHFLEIVRINFIISGSIQTPSTSEEEIPLNETLCYSGNRTRAACLSSECSLSISRAWTVVLCLSNFTVRRFPDTLCSGWESRQKLFSVKWALSIPET